MPNAEDDLKATTADVVADAERLRQVEIEKGTLDPADPRLDELAAEADAIARDLPIKTAAQRELVRELADGEPDGGRTREPAPGQGEGSTEP